MLTVMVPAPNTVADRPAVVVRSRSSTVTPELTSSVSGTLIPVPVWVFSATVGLLAVAVTTGASLRAATAVPSAIVPRPLAGLIGERGADVAARVEGYGGIGDANRKATGRAVVVGVRQEAQRGAGGKQQGGAVRGRTDRHPAAADVVLPDALGRGVRRVTHDRDATEGGGRVGPARDPGAVVGRVAIAESEGRHRRAGRIRGVLGRLGERRRRARRAVVDVGDGGADRAIRTVPCAGRVGAAVGR